MRQCLLDLLKKIFNEKALVFKNIRTMTWLWSLQLLLIELKLEKHNLQFTRFFVKVLSHHLFLCISFPKRKTLSFFILVLNNSSQSFLEIFQIFSFDFGCFVTHFQSSPWTLYFQKNDLQYDFNIKSSFASAHNTTW